MPDLQNVYDAVDYGGFVHTNSHPAQLAVMGFLHGLTPAAVESCQVLEIGCNKGRNLIPMACALPGATFVGVDLAAEPILRGQERIERLGLRNIRLVQGDLMELDGSLGSFDYILAHGVYAWVAAPVRDRLLAVCRELLTAEGIAFISYNALPGGHVRNLVREIMLQHLPQSGDRLDDVSESLKFLRFVTDARPEDDPVRALLEREIKQLEKKGNGIIFHDELAEGYGPVSFADFMAHARRQGLQYVSEAVIPPPNDPCFQPKTAAIVKGLAKGDAVAEEQMLDLLRFRMFRETLLCRDDRPAHRMVNLDLDLRSLGRLRVACLAEVVPDDLATKTEESAVYTVTGGVRVPCRHPGMIVLVDVLIAVWPGSLAMAEVEELLTEMGFALDAGVLTLLFQLVVARLLQLRAWEPPVGDGIATRPLASATSRDEARVLSRAATLIHTVLDLSDPLVRQLLALLDGTRDRAALLEALEAASPGLAREALEKGIDPTLAVLHRACVLVGEESGPGAGPI